MSSEKPPDVYPHALPLLLQESGHVGCVRHHAVFGDAGACHHLGWREEEVWRKGGSKEGNKSIECWEEKIRKRDVDT